MKVVHLSLSNDGGAGIAAYRLHSALRKTGIDSLMLVLYSKNDDPSVKIVNTTARPCLSNGPGISPHFYIHEQNIKSLMALHAGRQTNRAPFAGAASDVVLEDIQEVQEADIINLHWVAGIVDYARLGHALKGKQVVWTLHGMNDFTGGCHHADECLNYQTECRCCPQLGPHPFDYARYIFHQKLHGMQPLSLTAVSPSRWLARCAEQSRILSGRAVHHIPNGLPVELFRPLERSATRDLLNIAADRFVILFGAFDATNQRKGGALLAAAFKQLPESVLQQVTLVGFGGASETLATLFPCDVRGLGSICNEENLALIYSMADLFVMPSLAENLPNSILESLACGTPVVAFAVGGIPEIVEHQSTGYLATPFMVDELAAGIVWCMEHRHQLTVENCVNSIKHGFTDHMQADRYSSLYQSLLDRTVKS